MAADAATPKVKVKSMMAEVELECGGEISASQEEILAGPSFFDGNNGLAASPSASDEEEEVFATPPDATQKQEEEDSVTMCTLPFTPTPTKSPAAPSSQPQSPAPPSSQPQSPAPPSDDDDDAAPVNPRIRKPRVCVRKVRGARISTPTPSPKQEEEQEQQPPQPEQQPQPEQPVHVDPLIRAVLMIPARTTAATATTTSSGKDDPVENFLALCRQKGII
jgi:hypothetical protein